MNYNAPDNVPSEWQIGDVILNKYEVREVFEGGGMGLVYRVYHRDWATDMAVKSPRSHLFQTAEQIANFEREAETWVNLGLHPHIVSCYYVRRLGHIPRIYAEFVEGGSLSDWIRSGRLYVGDPKIIQARVLDIAIQIAWGLHFAHEKGLVHQDVKPANILMMPDGTAKVSDFGLASARRSVSEENTTARKPGQSILVQGSGFLTPEYASPEQFGGKSLTRASDVWSWAVLVLEMVKGECDWSDGRAAPFVLKEFYGAKAATDGLACILQQCFVVPVHQRSSSLLSHVSALIALYENLTKKLYPRSYQNEAQASSNALNNKGASLLDLGRTESGMDCLKNSLNANARNVHAYFNLLVMSWRLGECTDDDVIKNLSAFRDELNSSTIDQMLDHICIESGVPVSARTARLRQLPMNDVRLAFIHRNNSRIAAIRLFHNSEGAPLLMSVSRSGNVKVSTLQGDNKAAFQIALSTDSRILKCAITSDGRWIVFSQEKQKRSLSSKKQGDTKSVDTILCVVDTEKQVLIKTVVALSGSASCFRLLNEHEVILSGREQCRTQIWRLPDLLQIGQLDLSNPKKTRNLTGSFPLVPRPAWPSHQATMKAEDIVALGDGGTLAIKHGGGARLWKRPEKLGESPPGQRGFLDKMKRLCLIQPKLPVWRMLSAMPLLTRSHITGARIRCDGPSPMSVSHDGRLIAGSYPIHIWSSRGELKTTLPSSSYAGKYAFSRDSNFIVAGELKGFALWHIPTRRKLSTIAIDNYECELWDCNWQVDHVSIFAVMTNGGVFGLRIELPSPSNYLSLAVPTNFHETHAKSELKQSQVYLAEQALENQNHALALELLRSIQLQDDSLTDRSLHELEMHICSFGSPVELFSGALERVFNPVTEKGFFSTNSLGTQLLWIDEACAEEAKCGWIYHAVLFDATSGEVISEGTLSGDKLEVEDAKGMWVIGCGFQTTLLIDCENSSTMRCHGWHRPSLTPDGSSLLCRNIHKDQIELIDLNNNQLVSQMPISNDSDSKACISDDAAWAVVLIRECQQEKTTLAQYSCRNWRLIGTLLEDVGGYVSSIALCDCNSKVLISRRKVDSERSELELWDVVQKKYLHSCGRGGELLIAPDCYPYAFVGRNDGTVAVINCTLGKEIFSISAGGDSVESMTLSHDKLRLIVNGQRIVHLFWSFEFP